MNGRIERKNRNNVHDARGMIIQRRDDMKKCACGNDMEDWMSVCKVCFGKQLDAKRGELPKDRQESIERQVAAKCVAQVYTGRVAPEEEVVKAFNLFIKLIRG